MNLSEEIKSILSKYQKDENELEQLLRHNKPPEENGVNSVLESGKRKYLSFEEAVKRNRKILKDLETAKGNLRSKAIYSPSEMQWEHICKNYRGTPALPVTSWRCHCSVHNELEFFLQEFSIPISLGRKILKNIANMFNCQLQA